MKGIQAKAKSVINIYTMINSQWTDANGELAPPNPSSNAVGSTYYTDVKLLEKVNEIIDASGSNGYTVLFPKLIPGFIPCSKDTISMNGLTPQGDFVVLSNNTAIKNDPLIYNTSFCCNVPTSLLNGPQARKGTKVTLSSIYIQGSVCKAQLPLYPVANLPAYDVTSVLNIRNEIRNNQVTYYLILENIRPNTGAVSQPPNWRQIFYVNGSNKCITENNNTDPLVKPLIPANPAITDNDNIEEYELKGISRFTHPQLYLNVNNKEKYTILASQTLDLDTEGTHFNFKMYHKLRSAIPQSNSSKKQPIQTTFSNVRQPENVKVNTLPYIESGAVFLVRSCYGVYNSVLVTNNEITPTGTKNFKPSISATGVYSSDNSYNDGCRIYPNESFTMKVNYIDV